MALALGRLYSNRYVVLGRIDHDSPGAYAAVYLAEDRIDGKRIAVKESLPQNATARHRFERERRIQTKLQDPRIVSVLGVDDFGNSRCLILEYLPGGSLAEEQTRSTLDRDRVPGIVADVLRGLAVAHAQHIIHRDIKPGNVLLGAGGSAKLGDFGCAFDPEEPPLTRPQEVLGTDDWMAPQQKEGMPPDPRDDIFAVGLLLYDLLTGDHPRMARDGWRPRLDHVDERFREIVERATDLLRENRYASAEAMLHHLERGRGRPAAAPGRPQRRLTQEDLRLLTDPERVRTLFRKLLYPVSRDDEFSPLAPDELGMTGAAAELAEKGWTIAALGDPLADQLFVLLLQLRDLHGATVRRVAQAFMRLPANFLLVCTEDYERFVFVNPRRGRPGVSARFHKLVVDRRHPTRHAVDVLEGIACTSMLPAQVFDLQCEAFDVEKVTNVFYRGYAALLRDAAHRIREWNRALSLVHDEAKLDAFVQRLFSRILFLYFLQKKGWLAGRQDFLSEQYRWSARDNRSFFHDVLEPLFFRILNTDRTEGASTFGPIPYLNGGLFERDYDERTFIHIENELFDPASENGLLGYLNDYDFTIEEDTPAEVEVALDPEMLGKVFENLLQERERNASGTFYTPRPIVHYMCRESLLAYLLERTRLQEHELRELFQDQDAYSISAPGANRVEAALEQVRVVDPAVGSGAFLVGMLQTMVQVRRACKQAKQAIVARTGSEVAGWKREFIQNCLYGVDIKPEAVEIARLRLWLSLVVDLETTIRDVEPLPNLDYRVRAGNSLLEAFDANAGSQGALALDSSAALAMRRMLADQKAAYYGETDATRKAAARQQIEDSETRLAHQWLDDRLLELNGEARRLIAQLAGARGRAGTSTAQIERIQTRIDNYRALRDGMAFGRLLPFSYRLNFSEVYDRDPPGFDIVIANPPYVAVQGVNGLPYAAELKAAQGWLDDLYVHFLFRGVDLTRQGGLLVYITADTYLTIGSKQRLRDLLLENRILALARCDPFEATVDTVVVIACRQAPTADDVLFFANGKDKKAELFDDLGPMEGWSGGRDLALDDSITRVAFGPQEPLPKEQAPQYLVPVALYRQALKHAFFEPSLFNLALYERFMPALRALHGVWWTHITNSAAAKTNATALTQYRAGLHPGDITLLGLITEGGVGLQTSDNPRFLAHLVGTRWAEANERRLAAWEERWRTAEPGIWRRYQELLQTMPRYQAVDLLSLSLSATEKKRLGIGRMALYRTVALDNVVEDPAILSADEKRNGIAGPRCWVPFRKGDRGGNRWLSDEPLFIRWDRESVRFLNENSGKRGANMPVIRNPDLYFTDLVALGRVGRDTVIKARAIRGAVFDSGTAAFRSTVSLLDDYCLLAILNSPLATHFCKTFLNNTKFELNDLRMLPIVVPTANQRSKIAGLVQEAMAVQRAVLTGQRERSAHTPVESAINADVLALYGIDPATAPAWARIGMSTAEEPASGDADDEDEANDA